MKKKLPFWMKILWAITFPGFFIFIALGVYKFFSPTSQFVANFNGLNVHQNPLSFFYITISCLLILIWAIIYTFSFISAILNRDKIEWKLPYILILLMLIVSIVFNN